MHNQGVLVDFFREIKSEKLAQIEQGKVSTDLFSIILSEGGDVYSLIEDKQLADKTMYQDLSVMYLAAVATTQISVNNLMKYLHMD